MNTTLISLWVVTEIQKQMCESVLYKCEKISSEEAFEFIRDQSVSINNEV